MKNIKYIRYTLISLVFIFSCETSENQTATTSESGINRTILPIVPPPRDKVTEMDARNATAPPPFAINAPEGAPNVVAV